MSMDDIVSVQLFCSNLNFDKRFHAPTSTNNLRPALSRWCEIRGDGHCGREIKVALVEPVTKGMLASRGRVWRSSRRCLGKNLLGCGGKVVHVAQKGDDLPDLLFS